jgi:parallel beta-helix repeat protein
MVNIYKLVCRTFFACFFLTMLTALTAGKTFAQLNGNYTINKGAAASSTNYVSFQSFFTDAALQGVSANVNVTVLNGPYTEQVVANTIAGVSNAKRITIDGNGQVLQFAATSTTDMHTLRFNGADFVTVKNLNIKALGTSYTWGIHFMNGSDYNTIDNCVIECPNNTTTTQAYSWGIVFSNSTSSITTLSTAAKNCTVSNCTIKGGGGSYGFYGGIVCAPQAQNVNSNITLKNNTIKDFYSMGIYLYYAAGIRVEGNDISRPTRTNTTTAYGIYMYYYCYNDTLVNNKVHNLFTAMPTNTSSAYGINCYYQYNQSNSLVANNLIYDIESNGYQYLLYSYYSNGITFAHNTISQDLTTNHSSYIYGVYLYNGLITSFTSTRFVNNMVSITRPSTGYKYGYYYYAASIQMDYNNVYIGGTGNKYYCTGYASNVTDLASFQALTSGVPGGPFEMNSESSNPNFVNAAGGNFAPTVVQLDGLGTPVSAVSKDINGNLFDPSNPDPGAFSFDVTANVNRIVVASATNCQMQQEKLKVWVKNSSAYPQTGFKVAYKINGGAEVIENFVGTINPNDSAQHTFSAPIVYSTAGVYSYQSRIKGKTQYGPTAVTIKAAPLGAEFGKGSTFVGTLNSGNILDPDIVANPDQLNYDLVAPLGYNNADYGITWYISKMVAKTSNGATITSTDSATFKANASQSFRLRYKPSSNFTDSFIRFTTTVYSLTTNCFAPDIERVIFVAPRPKAATGIIDACDGEKAFISSASTISTGTLKYSWTLGDGTISDRAEFEKLYATHGTYNLKLIVTSNYGYKDSTTKVLNIYQRPVVDFKLGNQCLGTPVSFTDNSVVPNGSPVYSWSFGDNVGTSTLANPTYTYNKVGLFMATMNVVDAKGCIASITKPVTTSAKPVADFSVPALVCNQSKVKFSNTSTPAGNTGYVWDFGDGNTNTTLSPEHTYSASGNYIVKVTAQNEFGCSDVMTKTVNLRETPVVNYTTNSTCIGEPVNFTNTTTEPSGSTVAYSWSFGDGSSSSNKDETHTFLGVGTFEIVLKALATNSCEAEKRTFVTFGEKPIADFSLPQTACSGDAVAFTNSSVGNQGTLTYDWDLADGNASILANPTATYSGAGVRTIKLTTTSVAGCFSTSTKTITISATPNTNFVFESAKTGNGAVIFTPEAANASGDYKWLYGDGSIGNNKGIHTYQYLANAGLFKVTLFVEDNGCKSSTTKDVYINTAGINNANGNVPFEVYPNPTSGKFIVDLGTTVAANTTVKVMNLAGQMVQAFDATSLVNGQLNVDLTNMAAGVYFVQVQTDGNVATKKVTVSR